MRKIETRSRLWLCCLWYYNCIGKLISFIKCVVILNKVYMLTYVYSKNHPLIIRVQFRGNMSMHPWEITFRRLGSKLCFKNIAKLKCSILYEKTTDFLVSESWFWMIFMVGIILILRLNLKFINLIQSRSFLEKMNSTTILAMF